MSRRASPCSISPIERLESQVKRLLGEGQTRFVLDLSGLDYIDSAGIGTIVSCLTSIKKAAGEMRMAGANPRITRLLEITGVDKLMPLHPTVAEAAAG
jgi:anti-anti-sigma factor